MTNAVWNFIRANIGGADTRPTSLNGRLQVNWVIAVCPSTMLPAEERPEQVVRFVGGAADLLEPKAIICGGVPERSADHYASTVIAKLAAG